MRLSRLCRQKFAETHSIPSQDCGEYTGMGDMDGLDS